MKKNISVNLFGTLYNIDEDAYLLLQQYEQSVRRYFERKGEDDEVAQDVERRVAELFEELRQQGVEAMTIEHVRNIIRRIGEPGEIDGTGNATEETNKPSESNDSASGQVNDAQPTQSQAQAPPTYRKLYRDADDCMIGGVMAGLAHYIGGSATALRLLMVILGLFLASIPWLVILYLIACVFIPKAVTPEDKLRMMGKPVNLGNLGEGVINGGNDGVKTVQQRGCLGQMLHFIAMMFKIVVIVCVGFVAIIVGGILLCVLFLLFITLVTGVSAYSFSAPFMWMFNNDVPAEFISLFSISNFWPSIVSLIFACGLPLYCIVHCYQRIRGKVQPWSTITKLILLLLWLISIWLVISFGSQVFGGIKNDGFNLYYSRHVNVTTYIDQDSLYEPDFIDDLGADTIAVSDTIY